MARHNNIEDFIISLGIDINSEDAIRDVEFVKKIITELGNIFNRELDLNINTNDLDSVIKKMSELDVRVQSVISQSRKLSSMSFNFSSGQGEISTYQIGNIQEQINNSNLDENQGIEYSLSHRQNGKYVLNDIVNRYKEIESLHRKMVEKPIFSEEELQYLDSIQKRMAQINAIIKQTGEAVNPTDLNATVERFNSIIKEQKENAYAKYLDREKKEIDRLNEKDIKAEADISRKYDAYQAKQQRIENERAIENEIRKVEELSSLYKDLFVQKNKLSIGRESNENTVELNEQKIDTAKNKLKEYGIEVRRSGELSVESLNLSKIGIQNNEDAYNRIIKTVTNFNEKIRESNVSTKDNSIKESKDSINELINTYSKLISEKNKLTSSDKIHSEYIKIIDENIDVLKNKFEKYGLAVKDSGEISAESLDLTRIGIEKNSKAYNDVLKVFAKYNAEIRESNAKRKDSESQKELNEYIQKVNELYDAKLRLEKLRKAEASNKVIFNAERKVGELQEAVNDFSNTIKDNKQAVNAVEKAQEKYNKELSNLDNNLNRTGTSFGNFTKRMKESAENTLIYGTLYKTFNLLSDGISKSIEKIHNLDTLMTEIQMVTGETDQVTRELLNTYSDMGIQLGATTTQVAKGSVEWLRQGKTIEETNKLLTASTMLSKVGMIESAESTELMTATLNGFNMEANEAIGVVDKLSAVDLAYATSAEEIAVGLQYVASSAGMANLSLDQMIGLITIVSQTTRLSARIWRIIGLIHKL